MNQRERARLLRELVAIKDRMRRYPIDVTYGRPAHSLKRYTADIRRRDEIEQLLTRK